MDRNIPPDSYQIHLLPVTVAGIILLGFRKIKGSSCTDILIHISRIQPYPVPLCNHLCGRIGRIIKLQSLIIHIRPHNTVHHVARQHRARAHPLRIEECGWCRSGIITHLCVDLSLGYRRDAQVPARFHRGIQHIRLHGRRTVTIQCSGNQRITQDRVQRIEQNILRLPAYGIECRQHSHRVPP